eukprot:107046-Chlamydomonas_euryale.AAC.1
MTVRMLGMCGWMCGWMRGRAGRRVWRRAAPHLVRHIDDDDGAHAKAAHHVDRHIVHVAAVH